MLGWHITVFRQAGIGSLPADAGSETGARLAVWQTGTGGLRWLDELVELGEVVDLGGDAYPFSYTGKSEYILPRIKNGPPAARETWIHDPDDIIGPGWAGRTVLDADAMGSCRPGEWLLVEAFDES